ncbi:ead/Ea22-like family protein [Enterobacter hormaechei]
MSNIDKRALREAAEKHGDDDILALLDELEAKDRRNDELNSTLERWAVDRDQSSSELEAAEKRIAELELKLEAADKLQDSAFRHGLQHGFSYGQTDNQAGFEQAIQAYGQQWKGE